MAGLRKEFNRGVGTDQFNRFPGLAPEAVERRQLIADELQPLIDALKETKEALNNNTAATQGKGGAPDSTVLIDNQGGE